MLVRHCAVTTTEDVLKLKLVRHSEKRSLFLHRSSSFCTLCLYSNSISIYSNYHRLFHKLCSVIVVAFQNVVIFHLVSLCISVHLTHSSTCALQTVWKKLCCSFKRTWLKIFINSCSEIGQVWHFQTISGKGSILPELLSDWQVIFLPLILTCLADYHGNQGQWDGGAVLLCILFTRMEIQSWIVIMERFWSRGHYE